MSRKYTEIEMLSDEILHHIGRWQPGTLSDRAHAP